MSALGMSQTRGRCIVLMSAAAPRCPDSISWAGRLQMGTSRRPGRSGYSSAELSSRTFHVKRMNGARTRNDHVIRATETRTVRGSLQQLPSCANASGAVQGGASRYPGKHHGAFPHDSSQQRAAREPVWPQPSAIERRRGLLSSSQEARSRRASPPSRRRGGTS